MEADETCRGSTRGTDGHFTGQPGRRRRLGAIQAEGSRGVKGRPRNPVGQGVNPGGSAHKPCDMAEGFKCPGASVSPYVRRSDLGTFTRGRGENFASLAEFGSVEAGGCRRHRRRCDNISSLLPRRSPCRYHHNHDHVEQNHRSDGFGSEPGSKAPASAKAGHARVAKGGRGNTENTRAVELAARPGDGPPENGGRDSSG